MSSYSFYFLVPIVALTWIGFDTNAIYAFDVFKKSVHKTARDMGMYRKWFFLASWRLLLLSTLVCVGFFGAFQLLKQNPLELTSTLNGLLVAVAILGSLGLLALPHLAVHIRRNRFLSAKAAELSSIVPALSSEEMTCEILNPAEDEDFDGEDGWTAWHPSDKEYKENQIWKDLVPVAYLKHDQETSFIIPIDWEYFLAWKLPQNAIRIGKLLPIKPFYKTIGLRDLHGHEGWTVIRADLEDE